MNALKALAIVIMWLWLIKIMPDFEDFEG